MIFAFCISWILAGTCTSRFLVSGSCVFICVGVIVGVGVSVLVGVTVLVGVSVLVGVIVEVGVSVLEYL